jgi:hypothetical protein
MKKKLASFIFFVMTFTMQESFAAEIKPGTKCSTLNKVIKQNNKSLKCVKVNKKLYWKNIPSTANNGNQNVLPTKTATDYSQKSEAPQQKIFIKWSKSVTRSDIASQSQVEFEKWKAKQKPDASEYKSFIDPSLNKEDINAMLSAELEAVKYLNKYLDAPYYSFVSSSSSWIKSTIKTNNLNIPQADYLCGPEDKTNSIIGCSNSRNAGFVIVNSSAVKNNIYGSAVGAHEYFHVFQHKMVFGSNSSKPNVGINGDMIPAWFLEGSADWVGTTFYNSYHNLEYNKVRGAYEQYFSLDRPLEEYRLNMPGTKGYLYPYTIGRYATEVIVANVGFEAFLNIFIDFNKTDSFAKSFENATSIPLKDFYEYFESIRQKIGLPASNK